jgi:hypothetical protein
MDFLTLIYLTVILALLAQVPFYIWCISIAVLIIRGAIEN